MMWIVNLYWGGKIIPGPVIAYDPPFSNGYIVLNECVSYQTLVGLICERIGMNMHEHTILIIWKRTICVGSAVTFIGTRLEEESMSLMFSDSMSTGQIELFIEFSAITQQHSHRVINYDVGGPSRREQRQPSFGFECMRLGDNVTQEFDVGGMQLGDNEYDDILASEKPDFIDPPSPYEDDENVEIEGSDSSEAPSDEGGLIDSRPPVSSGRAVPQYPQRGMDFFRTLPSEYEVYNPNDFDDDDDVMWYWDEKNPTHIGLRTKFLTKLHLKTAVTLWHLEVAREYMVVESKSKRWHAVCKYPKKGSQSGFKCIWECRATLRKHDGKWEIREWTDGHTCMGDRKSSRGHANLSSSMVALCVRHQIENDPAYKPSAIVKDIHDKFHVTISYKKAWYARRKAVELVFGGWEESFKVLPSYMGEMQRKNPGTIVEWLHDERLSHGSCMVFKYVFWAFGPAVDAFQLCKPVLTVDGTHLRGRLRGKLLIAVGFDATKKCLPVAYAIVDQETNHSWNWFMKYIRIHIAKTERQICVISDRHPGIINAMNSPLWKQAPEGHHRFCLVHVRKNVLQTHKGIMVKKMVWRLGIATQKRKFTRRQLALQKLSDGAVKYLFNDVDVTKWSLLYDKCRRWGEVTTNIVESYNNVLRGARELPIKACIDITFWRTIEWFNERAQESIQCQTMLTPWAHDKVSRNDIKGQLHGVRPANTIQGKYEVRTKPRPFGKGGHVHTVKYFQTKCTCKKWQIWRLPCSHAAAVARFRNDNMLSLVSRVYLKSTWMQQYSGGFNPLRHPDYWEPPAWTLECSPNHLVPRSRGRYRKARIPNQMDVRESDEPRAPRRCKICRQIGHDRRSCSADVRD